MNCLKCGRFIRKRKMYILSPDRCDRCNTGSMAIRNTAIKLQDGEQSNFSILRQLNSKEIK